jgi:hypothetical protein
MDYFVGLDNLARVHCLFVPDLLRFQRLFEHGHWLGMADGLSFLAQLRLPYAVLFFGETAGSRRLIGALIVAVGAVMLKLT